ncbi:hypothetical protein [Bacillus sp. FSL K6-3431]|uniref:hypothetical protein n=1 Tax=Bacillus sp. FSL K6-3431 TaxID=2921500 RepID=UPI0030FA2181
MSKLVLCKSDSWATHEDAIVMYAGKMMFDICEKLEVSLQPDSTFLEVWSTVFERFSTEKLNKMCTVFEGNDSSFLSEMKNVLLNELHTRGQALKQKGLQ